MIPPRDLDRDPYVAQEIGRAEDETRRSFPGPAGFSYDDVPSFIRHVLDAAGCELEVDVAFDIDDEVVLDGALLGWAGEGVVHLPRTMLDGGGPGLVWTVLHELAHVAPFECPEHGPAFVSNLLALVEAALGTAGREHLAAALTFGSAGRENR